MTKLQLGEEYCCPICRQKLKFARDHFECEPCKLRFKEMIFCQSCGETVKTTSGCGATTYFCARDKLLSRKQCRFEYQPLNSSSFDKEQNQ